MQVLKFGGTSVANSENIAKVVAILKERSKKHQLITVVSALGGATDTLLQLGLLANAKDDRYKEVLKDIKDRHLRTANELGLDFEAVEYLNEMLSELERIAQGIYLINEFSVKTQDRVLSFGERMSSFMISEVLKKEVPQSQWADSRELIVTDANFSRAQVHSEVTHQNIRTYFKAQTRKVTVLPGFIARSEKGDTTTLGRGGSDFTAALVAAALDAEVLDIWTDVSGMYTANPNVVQQAFPIREISYQEAMELSHFG
ncbi:MAG: aspartate kinase, partial [Bacteroidota bacterium]